MKKYHLIRFLLIFSIITFNTLGINLIAQNWAPAVRLTNGFIDKNPSFGAEPFYTYVYNNFEFLAFERYLNNIPQICILKINHVGPLDSVTYITNNSYSNRYPSISYNHADNYWQEYITNSIVVWQTNLNGNWDIYGSKYTLGQGWSQPFIIVGTTANETRPRIICLDSTNYAIAFERNNDIFFKRYLNGNWLADTNLTAEDPNNCSNPYLGMLYHYSNTYDALIISYERIIGADRSAVYCRIKPVDSLWKPADTIAYAGNNRNLGFYFEEHTAAITANFESNRRGNWNIFYTRIPLYGGKYQDSIIVDLFANNFDFVNTHSGQGYQQAYVKKKQDSTIIYLGYPYSMPPWYRRIYLGDTTTTVKLAINRGVRNYGCFCGYYWVVFNKDTASFSNLYGNVLNIMFEGIKSLNSQTPSCFSLSQNYPNPFNPVTKIRFDISLDSRLRGNDNVSLKIYDILGREITTLVQEQLTPGTYEVEWDGSAFASGVYFYKLITSDFSETKKMVLIK